MGYFLNKGLTASEALFWARLMQFAHSHIILLWSVLILLQPSMP